LVILQENDKINHTKNQNEIIIKRNEALKKMILSKNLISGNQNSISPQQKIKSETLIDLTNFDVLNVQKVDFEQDISSNSFHKLENGLQNSELNLNGATPLDKTTNKIKIDPTVRDPKIFRKSLRDPKIFRDSLRDSVRDSLRDTVRDSVRGPKINQKIKKIQTKNSTGTNQNEITHYKIDNNLQNCFQNISTTTTLIANSEQNKYEIQNKTPYENYPNNNQKEQHQHPSNKMNKIIKNRRLISMK
jgi:hypothetical protein